MRVCLLALAVAAFACDKSDAHPEESGSLSRSQAVEAKAAAATTPAAATTVVAPSASAAAKPKRARKLCEGQLEGPGKPLAKKPISKHAAPGTPELEGDVPVGSGKWTWLNFWAAWCVPCKEEIPLLLGWEKRQPDKLRLTFVSIDDDERQLDSFLASQPAGGLKASFWLREGKEREDWLAGAGLQTDPELPLHALIDPKGRVRCTVQGAVDESDYEALQALLGR